MILSNLHTHCWYCDGRAPMDDFVKFAKFTASDEDNAKALPVAVRFVTSTYQSDLERFFQFWLEQKTLLDALERSGISGVLVTRSIDHALSNVGVPSRFLQQEEKLAREQATMFGVCGLMSMVLNWHKTGFSLSVSQMAAIAVELLTKPLFAAPEK